MLKQEALVVMIAVGAAVRLAYVLGWLWFSEWMRV
jgi:hypothetical protein